MSTKYRFSSDSFGLHLERMHRNMVNMYLSYLHSGAGKGNYLFYFDVRIEAADNYGNNPIYVMTVYDGTTLEQITTCLNKAYANLFAVHNFDKEIQSQHLSISIDSEYTWDKYNKTNLPTIRIHDAYFFALYYKDAVKFWFGK